MYPKYIKRLLDIICSLVVMIAFCWLYAILAILVKCNLGSPVLYTQERPGKNEKTFKIYKFRSMTNKCDADGKLLPDKQRLTKLGQVLRSTSLDELPELYNILKGDMSWCGPRPLAVKYLPFYSDRERHRHDVRPGLTGLAQVNGRNILSWEKRFEYDIYYVNHISFKLDCYIIFQTVIKVIKHENIVVRGSESSVLDFDVDRRQKLSASNINESKE